MNLTSSESSLLMMAGDNLSRYASHMYIEEMIEWQIAGLRYSLKRPFLRANEKQLSALLCKVREIYPRQAAKYVVFDGFDLSRVPWFNDLFTRYTVVHARDGWGCWRNRKYEEVVNTFNSFAPRPPYVMNRSYFQQLVQAYHTQARQAKETEPAIGDLVGMSAMQRKAVSAGKCYMCASPKRRKTPCAVCGYIPSSIE